MLRSRLQRSIEKNRNQVAGILLRRYPRFVWSDAALDCTPAFAFHDVTVETLAPMLEHLARNGYRTITADEHLEYLEGTRKRDGNEVLITFDDGRRSLFEVAYPLLRGQGFKATAYIVPGLTPEAMNPTGLSSELCTWAMIREMHDSGVIDIQSHSMWHHSIAVATRVVDFQRPGLEASFLSSDLYPRMEPESNGTDLPLGFPIHLWASRLGPLPAYRERPEVIEACTSYVARSGGSAYFERRGWQRGLRSVLSQARLRYGQPVVETAAERERAIFTDLRESRKAIERRLPGKEVRHFCFPWFKGSRAAVELSAQAGYQSNAWGSLLPKGLADSHGKVPVSFPRLPPKFIWRLPGTGRRPLKPLMRIRVG